jgi:hypothetical protein
MSDTENDDASAPGRDSQPRRRDGVADRFRIEAIPDEDAGTVTLVPGDPGDGEATTAWITADADTVVTVGEMQ